jgi:hypothetical protein
MDEPWGWQMDGHHLNLNDFVLKDHVVMTPVFWGAEPAIADRGPYAGLRECDAEQRNGLELIRTLSLPQQKQAIIFKSHYLHRPATGARYPSRGMPAVCVVQGQRRHPV